MRRRMKRGLLGGLTLMALLLFPVAAGLAARSPAPAKTIKDLSGELPLAVFQRSVGPKFYRSLLVSALHDRNVVRARVAGERLWRPEIIRPAANPAFDSLALKVANELTLLPNPRGAGARPADSAVVHLLIYQIADGLMAVAFAYPDVGAAQQMKITGTIRLSVKTRNGRWTAINAPGPVGERGPRLRRIDRMPMDVISIPAR